MSSESLSNEDHLARVFNTAMISTQAEEGDNFSEELFRLMKSPAFQSLLSAARDLSARENLSEREATELLIQTFRRLDALWSRYVVRQGLDKIAGSNSRPVSSVR